MGVEDVYDRLEEQRKLARILMPRYVRQLEAVHQMVASVFTEVGDFRLDDPATRKQLALAAERVVLIDQSTREALRDVLRVGQERGYSDYEVAHGVPADDYHGVDGLYLNTWRHRSETIARTEIATAQNAATLDRYAATGMVERVEIVESEDTDAPCAARNGQVVPLANKPGLLHPNCRVALIPVVEEPALEAPPPPEPEYTPEEAQAEAVRQKVLKAEALHKAKVDAAYKVMSDTVDASVPLEEEYWSLAVLPPGGRTPEQQAAWDRLRVTRRAALVEVEQTTTAYNRLVNAQQDAVRRALYVPLAEARTKIPVKIEAKGYTPEQRAAVKEAQTFLQRIMGKHATYPAVPVRDPDQAIYGGKRSYQTEGAVYLAPGQRTTATAVHELGHALEGFTYAWWERRRAWYTRRTAGDSTQPLATLRPNAGYEAGEVTNPDRFRDPYIGKVYRGEASSEVFSMGLEYLWRDAAAFARDDPDMFRFIVAALR